MLTLCDRSGVQKFKPLVTGPDLFKMAAAYLQFALDVIDLECELIDLKLGMEKRTVEKVTFISIFFTNISSVMQK